MATYPRPADLARWRIGNDRRIRELAASPASPLAFSEEGARQLFALARRLSGGIADRTYVNQGFKLDADALVGREGWTNQGVFVVPRLLGGSGLDLVIRIDGTYFLHPDEVKPTAEYFQDLLFHGGKPVMGAL